MNTSTVTEKKQPHAPSGEPLGMTLRLLDAGKRFNREWIFRHINLELYSGRSYAITGPNGSGKSTLLQAIAGSLQLSEGQMEYSIGNNSKKTEPEQGYRYLSLAAPYLELIEEMTAKEFLFFHASFKQLINGISREEILREIGLEKALNKQIRYFSSGMKQRLKLAQAVFSDAPLLLLDEPCTNLDKPGYDLYHSLIQKYCLQKLIIVSSNDANEMDFCTEKISILDYK